MFREDVLSIYCKINVYLPLLIDEISKKMELFWPRVVSLVRDDIWKSWKTLKGGMEMLRTKSIGKGMLVILLAVFTFACSTTKSMTRQDGQDLTPESSFKIALWADRKDKTYELGEDIYLFFAANKDCNLRLIHISSDGEERVLLPNQYQKDCLAKAGYIYQIPSKSASFTFKAREPVGEGVIKAVATRNEILGPKGSKNLAKNEITIRTLKKRP